MPMKKKSAMKSTRISGQFVQQAKKTGITQEALQQALTSGLRMYTDGAKAPDIRDYWGK